MMIWLASCLNGGGFDDALAGYFSIHGLRGLRAKENPQVVTKQHDLTFGAHSCTAHQIDIFAQEFEPASYFCDWTCVHLITSRQKQGPISENKPLKK